MLTKDQELGKYKILGVLGGGGFGTVYLAEDTMIQKKVALKIPHEQTKEIEKLLHEARLLARLDHPNIVRVYTADIISETFFIVMEFIEGDTLMARVKDGKSLPVKESVRLINSIGSAVEYAHGKNIIHRDLRPSNVLIEQNTLIPKVADFGTSRLLEAVSFAKTRIGSPPYMPPEQFDGHATFASDVYALGVIAYRLMSGKLPFFNASIRELEKMIKRDTPVTLNVLERAVPKKVSDVVMRAMERDQSKRCQTAGEFLTELNFAMDSAYNASEVAEIRSRIKEREKPRSTNCWNCQKPVPARSKTCPHCHSAL